jgi:hypothetical protein
MTKLTKICSLAPLAYQLAMVKIPLFGRLGGCKEQPLKRWHQGFSKKPGTRACQYPWIKNVQDITNSPELQEFVLLFVALSSVTLSEHKDEIRWRWTTNGQFTVSSAYECQFIGATSPFPATDIWKAHTELKCRFYVWLVMHNKALTTDNLIKKNWPCNSFCSFCFCQQETTTHILTECNFTERKVFGATGHAGAVARDPVGPAH